ncbi:ornithine cyclodeaminase family protein [Haloplanus sp. GCM10025708]|uniref:ornithine cyclodeaminase family protein n=1 Tax=Haloferacaceae TaxID=1644056 RepID=UPI003615D52E
MVRLLSDDDVERVLSLDELLPVVAEAFRKQGAGDVERPPRPHFPVGSGLRSDDPLGTGLVMPAYLHGADTFATKVVAVHEANAERGRPTVNAQITLTDAADGRLVAQLAGNRITNARTGCIGGLAASSLAAAPVTLALVGAGTQARWQARAIAAATSVSEIRVYSPSDSREACASTLRDELGVEAHAVESSAAAVAGANVVVTATTSPDPVVSAAAVDPGTLVVAVGAYTAEMQELPAAIVEAADRLYADVPEEVAEVGDLRESSVPPSALVPFSEVVDGVETVAPDELVVVESVGSAVLDAAAAEHVLDAAEADGLGTTVPFDEF